MREIYLNVYDLNDVNQYLYGMGIGFFHSGVEIQGFEFSFSSQGIIKTRPRLPQFGRFREQIMMGIYSGTHNSMYAIIYKLQTTDFGVGKYNTTKRNCNHFSDTLCYELLNIHVPSWINRAANIGSVILPSTEFAEPNLLQNGDLDDEESSKSNKSGSISQKSKQQQHSKDSGIGRAPTAELVPTSDDETQMSSTYLSVMSCFCCTATANQIIEDGDDFYTPNNRVQTRTFSGSAINTTANSNNSNTGNKATLPPDRGNNNTTNNGSGTANNINLTNNGNSSGANINTPSRRYTRGYITTAA